MQNFNAPTTRKDFIVVVDRHKPELLASVISYLHQKGAYLPIFTCSKVETAQNSPVLQPDIYAIQRKRSSDFTVLLNNAIIENGGCENLIFLGLSDNQKSFLDVLREPYNVLDIDDADDIEPYLGGFSLEREAFFECSGEQCPEAFFYAAQTNLKLRIVQAAAAVPPLPAEEGMGLVVVERTGDADMIMAVSYALSVEAGVLMVEPLKKREKDEILYLIERWQAADGTALNEIKDRINSRIGGTDMGRYAFATFFTDGLPYPLCVTAIPCSLVNLIYRPDFFVFNTIISEYNEKNGSAAIFSPGFFDPDEEVAAFSALFEHYNFYMRKMLGTGASVYNLRNTIELYPIDLLHICSHGGTVGGNFCRVRFEDGSGQKHVVEFDHVLSVGLTPYLDKHIVESLYYFKSLNGYRWRSEELNAQGYPSELYASLQQKISEAFEQKKVKVLARIDSVHNTNAIKCDSFQYNANFDQFSGSDNHPVIFNNTCWSWMVISNHFLAAGARGYVGTLREIGNQDAVTFAKNFYGRLFEGSILQAFQHASEFFLKDHAEPLYIYWGLHFSTIDNRNGVSENRHRTLERLKKALTIWVDKFRRRAGSEELLRAKILDTRWVIKNIEADQGNGHTLS